MSKLSRPKRPLIEALEPRLLFSATADVSLFDDAHSDLLQLSSAAAQLDLAAVYLPPTEPLLSPSSPSPITSTLVVIDTQVEDYQALVDGIRQQHPAESIEIIYLDASSDGITQITQQLTHFSQVNSLHIISHGSNGTLALGNALLSSNNVFQYENELMAWRTALTEAADILIYGCDVAATTEGQEFVARLAVLTQADVAASIDTTGHRSLQGDWDLEFAVGDVEQDVITTAEAQEAWVNQLASVHFINIQGGSSVQSVSSLTAVGQSFLYDSADPTYVVNQISVQLRAEAGAANQTITVQLLDEGWNDLTPLASKTLDYTQLGSTFGWKTINFDDVTLNDNQTYIVKIVTNNSDGKVSVAHTNNAWNNSEMIVNGTGNSSADLNLLVSYHNGVNQVSVNSVPGPQSTNQNSPLIFSSLYGNAIQVADADAFPHDIEVILSAAQGSMSVAQTSGVLFTAGDGTNDFYMAFRGSAADINTVLSSLTYTPVNGFTGTDNITITTKDFGPNSAQDTDNIVINVNNANDAPTVVITETNYYVNEQQLLNLHGTGIVVNDSDGDTLTVTLAAGSINSQFSAVVGTTGVIISSGNGTQSLVLTGNSTQLNNLLAGNNGATLTYRLAGNTPVATQQLTITASDGSLNANDTATINIAALNDAPVNTVPGAQQVNEDTNLVFSVANGNQIQVNDVDVGINNLEVTLSVTNGVLTLAGTTGLVFTTGDGTVDSTMVFRGTKTDINTALATLTFIPTANFSGAAALSIITSDLGSTGGGGTLTDNDTVNITVNALNDTPGVVITPPDYYAFEQTAINLHATGISVADVDDDVLTITFAAQWSNSNLAATAGTTGVVIVSGVNTKTLILSGTAAQLNDLFAGNNGGTLTYRLSGNTPVATDVVTVTASDGSLSGNDSFTVNITALNDAPVNTVPAAQQVSEDGTLVFSAANGNQIQVSDVDVASGNLQVTLSVTNGVLTLAGTAGLSFTTGDGTNDAILVFTGTVANINTALATLTYTPTANYSGAASLTIITNDLGNSGAGGALSDTDNVAITVNPDNYAPTIANAINDQNATEDAAYIFQFAANTFNDLDSNPLSYSAHLTSGGALPAWLSFDSATRTFSGTPLNANVGSISIDVTASDGNGGSATDTFILAVANSNDVPTVTNVIPNQNATEDAAFNFQFNANTFADQDVGSTLTYNAQRAGGGALPGWLSFDSATRTFSGIPLNADVGTLSIDVTANDGNGGTVTDTFDIVIANTNDAPTVINAVPNQTAAENTLFNFSFAINTFNDPDADATLSYSAQLSGGGALPGWLSFDSATRTFSGTPANGDIGVITIELIASDGSFSASDFFDITVGNVDDSPVLAIPIPNQNATEDTPFNFQFNAGTFTDPDIGDVLSYSAEMADGSPLAAWLIFDPVTRTFSGVPTNGDVGTLSIKVTAADINGGPVATDSFDLVIANSNDVPTVLNPISNQNATEDSAFNFTFAFNTFADQDVGNTLTYTAQLADGGVLPAWLSFDPLTRTFSGTPLNSDVGVVSIDVIANDNNGGTVTDTFTIVVANTNDAPTIANAIPNQNATEDAAFNFQFNSNTFADIDVGDALTYTAQLADGGALPAWLSFDPLTRTFSGTPLNSHVGVVSIDVIANDGNGATVTDTFDIVVANANDAPTVANAIPNQNATEDAAFNFQFALNTFADVDVGDTLTYTAQLAGGGALPAWLSFDPATRTFSGTPLNADVGSVSIDVIANDSNGGTVTDTFTIVVANTNDAPTAIAMDDMTLPVGSAAQEINLKTIFADVDDVSLRYLLVSNSNSNAVVSVQLDSDTGAMVITVSSKTAGESIIRVRAVDAEGAWAESSLRVIVSALTDPVVPPIIVVPPEPDAPPLPVRPDPIVPPVDTRPEPTLPDVMPPANEGDVPDVAPEEPDVGGAATPGLLVDSGQGNPGEGDFNNKSARDYERAEKAAGANFAGPMLTASTSLVSLIVPDSGFAPWEAAEFDDEVRRIRAQMDEALAEEHDRKAVIAGISFSLTTGLLIWSLRASSLLLTLMSMLPLWRGMDPLPILDEVNKRKKELEQQRKDRKREDKNVKEVGYLFDHTQAKSKK